VNIHPPGYHLKGDDRQQATATAVNLYLAGATIDSVARRIGRSYGSARTLLLESGVTLRARGGNRRKTTR
jgi:hypothetical protein